jgi:MerR family transcriptional regulator, light-induced transcriptional regulator
VTGGSASMSDDCRAYLAATLEGDVEQADVVAQQAIAGGSDLREVCIDVLAPALTAVGDLWQSGAISVAQEHLASAIAMEHLHRIGDRMPHAAPVGRVVLLTGTPGELHVIGLRMLRIFLESDGYDVVHLGASTPADDLVAMVAARRPDAVGLSTALTTHLVDIPPIIARLKALPSPPVVMVGGAAYGGDAHLAARMGADLYARDAQAASDALWERLGLPGA